MKREHFLLLIVTVVTRTRHYVIHSLLVVQPPDAVATIRLPGKVQIAMAALLLLHF